MDRCTGRRDITEILLKTPYNQAINIHSLPNVKKVVRIESAHDKLNIAEVIGLVGERAESIFGNPVIVFTHYQMTNFRIFEID